jgi:hypothetical protein
MVVVDGDRDISGSFSTENTPLLSQKEKQKLNQTNQVCEEIFQED